MTMNEYAKSRGLTIALIAQKMGVTRQALEQYGKVFTPTARTLDRIASAMTDLGAPTTVVDLVAALYQENTER